MFGLNAWFKNLKIQSKISFAILLTCSAALVVTGVAIFFVQSLTFRQSFKRDLRAIGSIIANNSTASLAFKDRASAEEIVSALAAKPHILLASIELPNGTQFAQFQNAKPVTMPAIPKSDGFHFVGPYLALNEPIILSGERLGTLRLVSDYRAEYTRSLLLYGAILGAVLLVSVLLELILSNRLQKLIAAPILALAGTAEAIAEKKDYSVRAPVLFHDEVGQLTDAFNQMLGRIQTQDEALTLSQTRLEALVNSIEGIVWECTPDTFQFTFVSRQSQRILGFTAEEWIANADFWRAHLHPEDRARVLQACRDAVAQCAPYTHEYRMLAADDRVVWIRCSGAVLVNHDKPAAIRGIFLDITGQKQAAEDLEKLNRRLIETSRQAGMAEVASGVLHNVGNVLNSVNVSANLILDLARQSRTASLAKLCSLLEEHRHDLGSFLCEDPKGKLVPEFLAQLARLQQQEKEALARETQTLLENVDHIKEIVAMQQSYATVSGVIEDLPPAALVQDALRMNSGAFLRHKVSIKCEFETVPPVRVDKHKVLQILINLIRNAKYAMDEINPPEKILTLGVKRNGKGKVILSVRDNGIGIAPENLTRIFAHGFTTRRDGHGFGLHSSSLAAKEMGGDLLARSDGPGQGATFSLELPIAPESPANTGKPA
jgi:PAS domain S-box-containing protein